MFELESHTTDSGYTIYNSESNVNHMQIELSTAHFGITYRSTIDHNLSISTPNAMHTCEITNDALTSNKTTPT